MDRCGSHPPELKGTASTTVILEPRSGNRVFYSCAQRNTLLDENTVKAESVAPVKSVQTAQANLG